MITAGGAVGETPSRTTARMIRSLTRPRGHEGKWLRRRADLRSLIFVACTIALTVQAFLRTPRWTVEIVLVPFACFLAFCCAVITHNSMHTRVFRQRWMNGVFQLLLSIGYGHPASAFEPGHNLSHHRYPQSARDVSRTTRVGFRWNLLNVVLFYPLVLGSVVRSERRYLSWAWRHRRRWFWRYTREAAVVVAVSGALACSDWRMFVLYAAIPKLYAAWGIFAINFVQHDGCDAGSELDHSRNFVGRVLNWLAFNNGFHTVHHLAPAAHWSDLPAIHAKVVHPHIHPELEQRSLLSWSWKKLVLGRERVGLDGRPVQPMLMVQDQDWMEGA